MTDFRKRLKYDHVPDPYYGGADGFDLVIDILEDACEGLLDAIKNNKI
jgi:protein-tyrosine phosphatase